MNKNLIKITGLAVILVFMLVILSGCGQTNVKLDTEKIKTEFNNATLDEFSISNVETNVYTLASDTVLNMEGVFDYDFEKYGLVADDIEEYRINLNPTNKDMYAVIKPMQDKKDAVKAEMNTFITKAQGDNPSDEIKNKYANMHQEEIGDYLVYVATADSNDVIAEKIRTSKTPILSMMGDVTTDVMEDTIGVKPEDVEEFIMGQPMMNVKADTYIIVKPAQGKKDTVKNAISNYFSQKEQDWSTYLPDQYEVIKNRMEKELGDYLVYIASTNNDKLYEIVEANKVQE